MIPGVYQGVIERKEGLDQVRLKLDKPRDDGGNIWWYIDVPEKLAPYKRVGNRAVISIRSPGDSIGELLGICRFQTGDTVVPLVPEAQPDEYDIRIADDEPFDVVTRVYYYAPDKSWKLDVTYGVYIAGEPSRIVREDLSQDRFALYPSNSTSTEATKAAPPEPPEERWLDPQNDNQMPLIIRALSDDKSGALVQAKGGQRFSIGISSTHRPLVAVGTPILFDKTTQAIVGM